MLRVLALRNLTNKPIRTAFLLVGYGLGVAVMIVLLSVGEALLVQARQEKLVGGGQITVLPEGIDVEVMKTGGLGGMFFSIDHARFVYRQLLASPALTPWVSAAAPQIEKKLLYLRDGHGREYPVMASGEIPSRMAEAGVAAALSQGAWTDDALDSAWRSPSPAQLRNEIDHFHLPPASAANDPTWAEWHYFNVLSADHRRWAFISFIVAGRVLAGPREWGGQVLVTLHEQGKPERRFTSNVPARLTRFSTNDADVRLGGSSVTVRGDGHYVVHAQATSADGDAVTVDLDVAPAPHAYFPGAALTSGETVSGYVVPALRADASGMICTGGSCERFNGTQAYHDHNWGTWSGVTWEWGSARAGPYSILYGRVQPADSMLASQPLFLMLIDSLGFAGLFRPRAIAYVDGRTTVVGGRAIATPSRAEMFDARGDDTLRVDLDIDDAAATDTRKSGPQKGSGGPAKPYFIQMKGVARLSGRVGGKVIRAAGPGFFETYR